MALCAGGIGTRCVRAMAAVWVLALVAALVSMPAAAMAGPARVAGTDGWGGARPVAGMAQITSVSCTSPGNCGAGGNSAPDQGNQAMVVSEVHGTWHKAIDVPGTVSLNAGEGAAVKSVSCASAGNCSVGGFYADDTTAGQVFVASEVKGIWHKAVVFPGIAALNTAGIASINSVSCASAGNCSAGGFYTDNLSRTHLFVVSQVRGTWHKPVAIPGIVALKTGDSPGITSVSCASAGNCAAGGWYVDAHGRQQAFVVSQVRGTWHKAIKVPGTATLNTAGRAEVGSVSCTSAGNCSAGGFYEVSVDGGAAGPFEVFVVSEINGTWRKAIAIPGIAALNHGDAEFGSLSCASPGNCAAGGNYIDNSHPGIQQAFVARQVNGTWRKTIELPGLAARNVGPFAAIASVSCASAGNCGGGGFYSGRRDHREAFVVSLVHGTWHNAIEVPGTAALNAGGLAQVTSVSCASASSCVAVGYYTGPHGGQHAFVVNRSAANGAGQPRMM